ncbi:MAG TPA: Stp1/IreP family PP2C-type Ser/Thr phosphatase [Syntrophomonas sp.]|jgi:protein phosphatase|nr:Stp1/IreP family PP2C-type Ser/Thr phosphatase [Syntrophomonas sp.]
MDTAYISDTGLLRKNNEDHYLVMDEYGLFVVCDGMGGHKGGDVASKIAVNCIEKYMLNLNTDSLSQNPISVLNTAINKANRLIWSQAQENPQWHEMGTTITAAMIRKKQLSVANVGDSSLYIFRNGKLKKTTRDHTLAEKMVADGLLKNEEKKSSGYNHILTRALGIQEEVVIDNFEYRLYTGDLILLCSDGLSDMLDDKEMATILNQDADLQKNIKYLLDAALKKGGYDNITIILLRI